MAIACLSAAGLAIGLLYAPADADARSARYVAGIDVHKLLGFVGFAALMVLVLLHHRRPPRTGAIAVRLLAMAIQTLLALLVAVLVVSGYLASSLFGNPLALPGLPALPPPVAVNKAAGAALTTVHDVCAYLFLALASLHIAVALFHHFRRKDDVLAGMLDAPFIAWRKPPKPGAGQ